MPATIRLAKESDAADIAAIYGPVVRDTAISFEMVPPTQEEFRQRISTTLNQSRTPWLAYESDGVVLGYVYAGKFRTREAYQWTAETTVYLHPSIHGRGVGKALYVSLIELLKSLGYFRAVAGITLPNPASVGLHKSLGFTSVGVYEAVGYKFDQWHDVGWWQLAIQPLKKGAKPPIAVETLLGTRQFDEAIAKGMALLKA